MAYVVPPLSGPVEPRPEPPRVATGTRIPRTSGNRGASNFRKGESTGFLRARARKHYVCSPPWAAPVGEIMRIRRWFVRSWVVVVVVASLLGTAVALTAIFAHTFPSVTVTPAVLTTTCSSMTLSQSVVIEGTTGSIVARCDGGPAFTVATAGTATPSYVLPAGYLDVAVFTHTGAPYCTPGMPGWTRLSPGAPVSFDTATEPFDYCLTYSSPTGDLATFTVTWSQ